MIRHQLLYFVWDYTIHDNKAVPIGAYVLAAHLLQPFAKSIVYGEVFSAVPMYMKK
jgi:hypothetical protein